MDKLRKLIRESFEFSEREANGFIVLSGLLILILLFPWAYRWYLTKQGEKNDTAHPQLIFQVSAAHENSRRFYSEDTLEPLLTNFNPNTVTKKKLEQLGIEPEHAMRIIKYRNAGGRFYEKEDLLKIYGFPDSLYKKLEPYIILEVQKKSGTNEAVAESVRPFDLNKADTSQLSAIYGIGKVLSARIVKFREKLGGFISKEQLYEVYGLDSATVEKLIKKSFIEKGFEPVRISINLVSEKELAAHPYCNSKIASVIIAYRNQHGPYSTFNDLEKSYSYDPNYLTKLLPYLSFQEGF